MRLSAFLLLTLALSGAARAAGDAADPANNEERIAYALGLTLAENLREFALSPREFELVLRGLEDGQLGREPKVSLRMWGPRVEGLRQARARGAAQRDAAATAAFLAKAASAPGAVKTPSGLVFRELSSGSGASPKPSDRVRVAYTGTLHDGTVFDSTAAQGRPASFALDGVIACWREALPRMRVGGKAEVTCPAELAYGAKGAPPAVPPNAALRFEVELLGIGS